MKNNFKLLLNMFPSGEKFIKLVLKKPKLFMRLDILLMISHFFNTSWPKYPPDSQDLPNFYSTDQGNVSRQEMILKIREGLLIFENDID